MLWNHDTKEQGTFKCYFCEHIFESKPLLMKHRKNEHYQAVKTCNQFLQNNCRFKNTTCWFKHEDGTENIEGLKNSMNDDSQSVFQAAPKILEPPLEGQKKK